MYKATLARHILLGAMAATLMISLFAYRAELSLLLFPLPPDTTDAVLQSSADGVALVPPAMSSPREEAARTLFSDVLGEQHAEILVVPITAPAAASVDSVARSLITRRLADAIAQRSGLVVADVSLVQHALGLRRRSYESGRIEALARRLGARIVVTGEVTRAALSSPEFRLKLRVSGTTTSQDATWPSLIASESEPPEEVFHGMLSDVLVKLSLSLSAPATKPASLRDELAAKLPPTPFELVDPVDSTMEAALRLQLFASLHPAGEMEARLLWERSLLTLDRMAEDALNVRLMRARALLHLGRRPAALALIAHPRDAAETALFALAQGNLSATESATAAITAPGLRLISALESQSLRRDYGVAEKCPLLLELQRSLPAYALFLETHFASKDFNTEQIAPRIVAELQARSILATEGRQGLAAAYRFAFGDARFDLALAIEATRERVWRAKARDWGGWGLGTAAVPADYFNLLYAINRAAALSTVRADRAIPQQESRAHDAIKALKAAFGADAELNLLEADALQAAAVQRPDRGDAPQARERMQRLARDAYLWEGADSQWTGAALQLMGAKLHVPYQDEPPYAGRRWVGEEADPASSALQSKQRRLRYTRTDFSVVEDIERDLREAGRDEELQVLQIEIAGRFEGSPRRASMLARLARERGDLATEEKIFRAGRAANPADWNHYEQLARVLLLGRHAQEAAAVLRSFPAFEAAHAAAAQAAKAPDVSGRVSAAFSQRGAQVLLDAGEAGLAGPLLALCARLDPGGAIGAWGAEMQAFLRGDLADAARYAEQQMREHGSASAAARLMDYAFLLNDATRAWQVYAEASAHPGWTLSRWAAVFGAWLDGGSERDMFELILHQDAARESREHRVFMTLFLDKAPSDEAIEMLRQVGVKRDNFGFQQVAAGIQAWRRHDYPALIRGWSALQERLFAASERQARSLNYALPYLALAHWSLGKLDSFKPNVEKYSRRFPRDFDTLLALAVMSAAASDPDRCVDLFWQAFIENPGAAQRPIPTELMLLDVLEGVYEQTRNARYRALLVDVAQRMQRSWPTSYYYAFEARYALSEPERLRALGIALYLDRNSAHLAHFSEEEKEAARKEFARNPSLR